MPASTVRFLEEVSDSAWPALAVYERLGFTEAYRYGYRVKG